MLLLLCSHQVQESVQLRHQILQTLVQCLVEILWLLESLLNGKLQSTPGLHKQGLRSEKNA